MSEPAKPYPWVGHYPPGLRWDNPIDVGLAGDIPDHAARDFPDHPALYFMGRVITYRQMQTDIVRIAGGLQALGIAKGHRVGLLMPNCPDFVLFYYAVLKIGAVVVNINPLYAEQEILHLVTDSQAGWVVTVDLAMIASKLRPSLRAHTGLRVVMCDFAAGLPPGKGMLFRMLRAGDRADWQDWPEASAFMPAHDVYQAATSFKPVDMSPDDLAILQYTGGTTGVPKAAMLSHANVTANINQGRMWLAASERGLRMGQERLLAVLPLFHSFAMTVGMNLCMAIAGELVLMPRFVLADMVRLIARRKVTIMPGVPGIFASLANLSPKKRGQIASLSVCIAGGAPLPLEIKSRFEQQTGIVLVEGYGLTEASPVVAVNPLSGGKAGSIGQPLPGTVIEIIDPDYPDRILPIGEKGEICVRGPQIMRGYWQNPEASGAVLKQGRLHTGDIGYLDDEGFCFVVDRIKDLILVNGFNVYPRFVEDAIYQHPDVAEVVVGGLPDKKRGETVKAWIYPRAGVVLTAEIMRAFLQDKISPIEMPRHFEFRTEPLPKTLIGKLSRKALIEQEKPADIS